ncbi:MAG: phosphoglycerate kinase [Elusimicrobia bacterium]|nr:phosphoglycerate kinase [Elusimicrobiota bacterium]
MKTIKQVDFKGKKVFIRVDFNVPVKDGKVSDNTRILAHLQTINFILNQSPKAVILASHLGRPKGERKPELSLKVVVGEVENALNRKVIFLDDCIGEEIKKKIENSNGDVFLLENLRFHKGEEKNDENFARELSSLADVFVQDAFAVVHRAHASTVGITKLLPSYAGFLIEKEVQYLSNLLENPQRPFVAVLGGAKVSTKISVIENLLKKVDKLLIGGAMSYTILKAKGIQIGSSLYEEGFVEKAKEFLKEEKLILPCDHLVSKSLKNPVETKTVKEIPDGFYGVDIGDETIKLYHEKIKNAKTIFWNGPLGIFEVPEFSKGTVAIAKSIAERTSEGAVSVAGGGDSVSAIKKGGFFDKFSHISTGGGASLEFVEGKILPGIEVLK